MKNTSKLVLLAVLVSSMIVPVSPGQADPGVFNPPIPPFPVPPPRVFCFRVTDIEADASDPNTFTFEFEFLNWTNQLAHGAYIWANEGTSVTTGTAPLLQNAGVDPDGRGGPLGGDQIGPGNYNVPAHQSGRGRGDIPGHLNNWEVLFTGPTSVFWGDSGDGDFDAIPFRSMMTQPNSASQFALVPGLGNDGLLTGDTAIDGGPATYGPPTQAQPFATGGRPNPDGSGNVLDGFTITLTDFHPGEVASFNWILANDVGDSIGSTGSTGNTVGNVMGFGVFNLVRVEPGGSMPPGPFVGNSGFTQGVNFYPNTFVIPEETGPPGELSAEFGVEFGASLLAPPLSSTVATEAPAGLPIPNIDPVDMAPNTSVPPCGVPTLAGDANGNGTLTVADLQCKLLVATWQLGGGVDNQPGCLQVPFEQIDLNCDGLITISDALVGIQLVLNAPLPLAIDGNQNQCHDSCDCTEALCDDGNACTEDRCNLEGLCVNIVQGCDDGDPCTFDTCDPATGCVAVPVGCEGAPGCFAVTGAACTDGNACTIEDACDGTECVGSVISCDDNNPCTQDTCDPELGCVNAPLINGTSCGGIQVCINGECTAPEGCFSDAACNSSSNPCTVFECKPANGFANNVCVPVGTLDCDDDNPCTDDSCNPILGGCENIEDDTNDCTDGDLCTINEQCQAGSCVSEVNDCDDGNPCTIDNCAGLTGCWGIAINSGSCDDGDACTENTTCQLGHCLGSDVICNDNNVCTADSCDSDSGCVFDPNPCDDGNPCTNTACDSVSGCEFGNEIDGTVCDDGEACTFGDTCTSGTCDGSPLLACTNNSPVICSISGLAGEIVTCPLQLLGESVCKQDAWAFQADLSYSNDLMLMTFNDGEFCAPSNFQCDEIVSWDLPAFQSNLQSGHTMFLSPGDLSMWDGGGTMILLHLLETTTPLNGAFLDTVANEVVGDPTVVNLVFELQEDISSSSPALVTLSGTSITSGDALELPVSYGNLLIFTGTP